MILSSEKLCRNKPVIQQESSSSYASKLTIKELQEMEIKDLFWPSNIPNLKPFVNLWGFMEKHLQEIAPRDKIDNSSSFKNIHCELLNVQNIWEISPKLSVMQQSMNYHVKSFRMKILCTNFLSHVMKYANILIFFHLLV